MKDEKNVHNYQFLKSGVGRLLALNRKLNDSYYVVGDMTEPGLKVAYKHLDMSCFLSVLPKLY